MSLIKDWLLQHSSISAGGEGGSWDSLQLLQEEGEAHLLLEMGKQGFGYIFLTIFCTMALKLNCVSSVSVAGLGYVVTAAVVLSAVVSDQHHNETLTNFYSSITSKSHTVL